ncbi:MAG: TetR/AcrR family transcriptional regulator [Pseudomonadota bacterium]
MDTRSSPLIGRDQFDALKREHAASGGWQRRKSKITQLQLLEATVECIVNKGFAQVRTRDIAEAAGLSRGAIMHHFANKGQLFEKALVYVHRRRLEDYRRSIEALDGNDNRAERGLEIYLEQLKSHYFVAAQELLMAARSDDALAKILSPQRKKFHTEWDALTLDLFPEWSDTGPVFRLVMQVTQFMMEGMVINGWFDEPPIEEEQLLDYLKARVSAIHSAAHDPGADEAVKTYLES